MSILESQVRETPAAIRRRLFNPVGGRISTELDVISPATARKLAIVRQAQEEVQAFEARQHEVIAASIAAAQQARETAEGVEAEVPRKLPQIREIITEVCRRYSIEKTALLSPSRKAPIVLPRQISMYLCRTVALRSFHEIGRRHGDRDHTTAHQAVGKITKLVETYPHLAAEIADIKKSLEG